MHKRKYKVFMPSENERRLSIGTSIRTRFFTSYEAPFSSRPIWPKCRVLLFLLLWTFWVRDIFKERRSQGATTWRSWILPEDNNLDKLFIKINPGLCHFVQMLKHGGIWNECFNWQDTSRRSKFPCALRCFVFTRHKANTSISTRKGKILILVLMLASRPFSRWNKSLRMCLRLSLRH